MLINCPNVPDEILNPIQTWSNRSEYINKAHNLANLFHNNFEKIKKSIQSPDGINNINDILLGGPIIS